MAVGGWMYYYYEHMPHGGTNAEESTAMDGLVAKMVTMPGWSLHQAKTAYIGGVAWWWSIEHTTGARAIFVKVGDNASASACIHANNDQYGATRTASAYEGCMFAAYIPPSEAGALTGDPDNAAFFPSSNRLRFTAMLTYTEFDASGEPDRYHIFHMLTRDDGLFIGVAVNAHIDPDVDFPIWMGEMLDQLVHKDHATHPDTHPEAKYAMISLDNMSYSATARVQYFDADHTKSIDTGGFLVRSAILDVGMNDRAPWNWDSPLVYRADNDLDTWGVVPGNGLKGTINPEWLRISALPSGINDKGRMDGGNFVYLRGGIVTGYDPSNGEMK